MSSPKTKKCQNCESKFPIEPEDFEFYEKMEVPEPTFCPECRMQRRMAWRKEKPIFYKDKCTATGKDLISAYHPDSPIKIIDEKHWFSDKWDPLEAGKDYDFERPFFGQFAQLLASAPQPHVMNDDVGDSVFCNECNWLKDCYLVTNSGELENVAFSNRTVTVKDSMDALVTNKSELCYEIIYCDNSFKLFFSDHCDDCVDSFFLYDCRHCENCFCCTNLRHKKYHIFNKPYSKEEYFKKLKSFNLGSFEKLQEYKSKLQEMRMKEIHRFANIVKSPDSTGNELVNSKNCKNCFDVHDCENMKWSTWAGFGYPMKEAYDCGPGIALGEFTYESVGTGIGSSNKFMFNTTHSHHCEYSYHVRNCEYVFGCAGLRHKKYCILNKQYTKKEYQELLPRIKKHMNEMPYTDKQENVYKYGEFFPPELSLHGYNESIAQEFFPLSVKEIEEKGYVYFKRPKNEYEVTVKAEELPDHIDEVKDSILEQVVQCANEKTSTCGGSGAFRFIPRELEFYRKHNLPLPRLCPICRHEARIAKRSPIALCERQCMCNGKKDITKTYTNQAKHDHDDKRCPNIFQTTYAPDRKEIIYCKECYQKEVE